MASPINPSSATNVTTLPANGRREQAGTSTDAGQSSQVEGRQGAAAGGNAAPVGQVTDAARNVSDFIQTVDRSLQISVDDQLGATIITVVDSKTDEVIRQIPQEELVELARFIAEQRAELEAGSAPVRGLLMDREG